ncbi:MAG TPA: hypothetical protein VFK34_02305 [Marmoricola sp.]|jgi:hypothetical protein|nr:hypothetical protein [Marmoricola sp.]
MMRLVAVELNRYRSRRAIAVLVLLTVALAAAIALKTAWDTRPMSQQEIATARAQADIQATRSDINADLRKCIADPESYLGPRATAQECRDALVPSSRSYLPRAPLDLAGTLEGNGLGLAVLVVALLLIAASTFAGADWATGSMATQLLFEPRRLRLWSAKAIAVTLASGAVAVVSLGGFWLATYLVAQSRGIGTSDAVLGDVGWHLLRAVLLAMGAGLGGYALTMLFRHTVGTLALLFAYSVGGELLVTLPFEGAARWSLGNNVFGWLEESLHYLSPSSCSRAGECSPLQVMTHLDAGLYLLALLVVAVVASAAVFRRADV